MRGKGKRNVLERVTFVFAGATSIRDLVATTCLRIFRKALVLASNGSIHLKTQYYFLEAALGSRLSEAFLGRLHCRRDLFNRIIEMGRIAQAPLTERHDDPSVKELLDRHLRINPLWCLDRHNPGPLTELCWRYKL